MCSSFGFQVRFMCLAELGSTSFWIRSLHLCAFLLKSKDTHVISEFGELIPHCYM
ncbi:hypothetical protein LINGRAHAP2_LOCUS22823 [Linum grandiflorum]